MQQFNEYIGIPFNLIWKTLFNWIKGNSESAIENVTKPLEIYKVAINSSIDHQKVNSKKPSAILKRCEGARGILYISEDQDQDQSTLSHIVLKKTRIIEVKDVSMKIRVHEDEVVNQLVYIENILGFLKEVD